MCAVTVPNAVFGTVTTPFGSSILTVDEISRTDLAPTAEEITVERHLRHERVRGRGRSESRASMLRSLRTWCWRRSRCRSRRTAGRARRRDCSPSERRWSRPALWWRRSSTPSSSTSLAFDSLCDFVFGLSERVTSTIPPTTRAIASTLPHNGGNHDDPAAALGFAARGPPTQIARHRCERNV